MLTKMIKWASTAASMVSAPASRVLEDKQPVGIPLLPAFDDPADPVAPASPTNAPLILDMNNIPNPDDVGAGDVW